MTDRQTTPETATAQLSIINARLKRHDYAGYLSIRMAAKQNQEKLSWLFGLFMELQRIPYKVDEPMLGEIRLQWWRDQLKRLARGESVGHPVADGLVPFLVEAQNHFQDDALLDILNQIIESFLFEVRRAPVQSKKELMDIFDQRYGGLIRAGLLLSHRPIDGLEDVCRGAGIAIGMTEMMADLPRILHKGIMPLPQDVLASFELYHEDFLKDEKAPQKNLALGMITDETLMISWDIKKLFKRLERADRALFVRWHLVPSLLGKALEERGEGALTLTRINPLKVFFIMLRGLY